MCDPFIRHGRAQPVLGVTYFTFENERSPLQFVTIIIKYIRNAISTFGNEHLTRIYDKLVKKKNSLPMLSSTSFRNSFEKATN